MHRQKEGKIYPNKSTGRDRMNLIEIINNGQDIKSTNYWQIKHAQKGFCYLSINAGCFRLLVPPGVEHAIKEMQTAQEVIITRGPWPNQNRDDALEILFEDHSESPYVLHIVPEQVDRMPSPKDQDLVGKPHKWNFSIWTEKGKVLNQLCRFRAGLNLPCMQPWGK
ncbi:MAG: hypothetical protein Q8K92_22600 [Leadbetterella sp.]|nr:hypothetical protein [Leadbetterella sp.]